MILTLIDAGRFRMVYDKAYKEEASRPLDLFLNWQLGANSSQRPESVISNMSPPGTPFTMSPELRGQASPVWRPQQWTDLTKPSETNPAVQHCFLIWILFCINFYNRSCNTQHV